jgi:hypothetical protein
LVKRALHSSLVVRLVHPSLQTQVLVLMGGSYKALLAIDCIEYSIRT